jgi:8-oxo-dGTP diphosphatase
MKEIHVVGAAILEGSKVLAAQRSNAMSSPMKWEFAGGKVEPGETHQQALQRELKEELGIEAEVGESLATGRSDQDDHIIFLHVYEASVLQGEPVAFEHARIRWVEIDGMGELDWAEADIPACKELMKRYGSVCWNFGARQGDE